MLRTLNKTQPLLLAAALQLIFLHRVAGWAGQQPCRNTGKVGQYSIISSFLLMVFIEQALQILVSTTFPVYNIEFKHLNKNLINIG